MKRKTIMVIAVALLAALTLTACGEKTVPTMEVQKETQTQKDSDGVYDENWWQGKAFYSESSGFYFWVEEVKGHLWFVIGPKYNSEPNTCLGHIAPDRYTVKNGMIMYITDGDNSTLSVSYAPELDAVALIEKMENGLNSGFSDVYKAVPTTPQPTQPIEPQPTPQPEQEFTEEAYFPGGNIRYECFSTETGEDIIITTDYQDKPYLVLPGAIWIQLEITGKGDAWEYFNEDTQQYSKVAFSENIMTITTEGISQYDGEYIQIADLDTDREN